MNKKIIYVDFVFRRKRISSKKLHFLCSINIKLKNLFQYFLRKQKKNINSKIYPFKKVL
ncbi:hypothetical protein JCM1393_15300 [Clostridium carnis]